MNVTARYPDGVFIPLEPVKLDEGAEVIMSITPVVADRSGGKGLLQIIDELDAEHPSADLTALPVDLAENVKRYPYGRASV